MRITELQKGGSQFGARSQCEGQLTKGPQNLTVQVATQQCRLSGDHGCLRLWLSLLVPALIRKCVVTSHVCQPPIVPGAC